MRTIRTAWQCLLLASSFAYAQTNTLPSTRFENQYIVCLQPHISADAFNEFLLTLRNDDENESRPELEAQIIQTLEQVQILTVRLSLAELEIVKDSPLVTSFEKDHIIFLEKEAESQRFPLTFKDGTAAESSNPLEDKEIMYFLDRINQRRYGLWYSMSSNLC